LLIKSLVFPAALAPKQEVGIKPKKPLTSTTKPPLLISLPLTLIGSPVFNFSSNSPQTKLLRVFLKESSG